MKAWTYYWIAVTLIVTSGAAANVAIGRYNAERAHREQMETVRSAMLAGYIAAHQGIPITVMLDNLDREGDKLLQRRLAEERR